MGFVHDRPVGGTSLFVGRSVLLRTLQQNLPAGRSYAILAGPRTGRTSLGQQLVHLGREALRLPGPTGRFVPCLIDMNDVAARPQALCQKIWQAVTEAVLDPIVQAHPDVPRAPTVTFLNTVNVLAELVGHLTELFARLRNTPGWCRWALVIDNAHRLSQADFNTSLPALAELVGGPTEATALCCLGGAGLASILARPKGPLRRLRPLVLAALGAADLQALARQGSLAEAPALAEVLGISGGHPVAAQCLLQKLEAEPDAHPHDLGDAAGPALAATFAAALAEFPPRENRAGTRHPHHRLLELLIAHGGAEMPVGDAERALGAVSIRKSADFLAMQGVLTRSIRGNVPCVRAGCLPFNAYFQDHGR